MIETHSLCKYYGRITALRDVNLAIQRGEFVALLGKNGAGKTTFLRILAGLTRPSAGTVKIHTRWEGSPASIRRSIGYLSHNTFLYQDLTALENLRFYAELMNISATTRSLQDKIALVGLAGREREPVRNYSRGMQQRLAIARAFLHDPDILLLDEPFSGLDYGGAQFLKNFLTSVHSKSKTCILTIHDAVLGYEMADRLVVIEKGRAVLDVDKKMLSLAEFQKEYQRISKES